MKILVIGGGGREHALVWQLAKSPQTTQLWCAPGNAGIALEKVARTGLPVECVALRADDLDGQLALAKEKQVDLVVVGPDDPLGQGIVDLFQSNEVAAWGPNKVAAQFESSKAFSQQFVEKHGVPAAGGGVFDDPTAASRFAASLGGRCAVKADGLALGKGVLICRDMAQADAAVDQLMVQRSFGEAGRRVVIQELLQGMEISLHAFCDGKTAKLFPTSQDHKRAFDGDEGPNTGGMGTYSPAPFLNPAELISVERQILKPWVKGCQAEGIDFRGILYPGIMLTEGGPKVLEFNARFGDPEAQVYLPRLETDLVEIIQASLDGTLDQLDLQWNPRVSVCVVMASGGYPGSYPKGKVIRGIPEAEKLGQVKVFHAGTANSGGEIVTNGGRVLGVTAWSDTLAQARDRAYEAVQRIEFEGAFHRTDIAAKALTNPLV